MTYEEIKSKVEKEDKKFSLLSKEDLMNCFEDYLKTRAKKWERSHSYEEGEKSSESSDRWRHKKKKKHYEDEGIWFN